MKTRPGPERNRGQRGSTVGRAQHQAQQVGALAAEPVIRLGTGIVSTAELRLKAARLYSRLAIDASCTVPPLTAPGLTRLARDSR
jgi:hypothetical protein